jgi:hypothetical protein
MTPEEYEYAISQAEQEIKHKDGHTFALNTRMKTRCIYCGRSPRTRGKCKDWFQSFKLQLYKEICALQEFSAEQ